MYEILAAGVLAIVALCAVVGIICFVALLFYKDKVRCPTCDSLALRPHGHCYYCPICGSYFVKDEHGILRQVTKF